MSNSADTRLPPPARIRALALDLDGTILGPGAVLSGPTLRVLNTLRERGIQLIIATGRAVAAAERFRIPLGAEGPMVYFNGAVVADTPSLRPLEGVLLKPEIARFCADLARRTGVYYQVFFPGTGDRQGNFLIAERDGPERLMYYNHTGLLAELGGLEEALEPPCRGCIKAMFLAGPEVQERLRPEIEERFGGEIYLAQTLKTFLEIMDSRVSKGEGLKRVLEYRGLRADEVLAFGDEENDLPMFAEAGFSLAPANAKDRVKEAANLVIGSNLEDGPALFLEKFFGL